MNRKTIDSALLVCSEIRNITLETSQPVSFTQLVERLKGERARLTISKAVDICLEEGLIIRNWIQRPIDNKWCYGITLTEHGRLVANKVNKLLECLL